MNSYLGLIKQQGVVNRKKNRITLLCIAVAVCLVTTIFGMADMEIRTQIATTIKSGGNYHVMLKGISVDAAKLIGSRVDVGVSGWIGSSAAKGYTLHGKPLSVIGIEPEMAGAMGLDPAEGHFPQKRGEVMLDRQAMEQFSFALDTRISVNMSEGSSQEYTVVGVYRDFGSLKKADGHGLVVAYGENPTLEGKNEDSRQYLVQFKKRTDMQSAIKQIKQQLMLDDQQVVENTRLLGLIGQSRESYLLQLYTAAGILSVLVLAAGVLMIASSFNMSVLERTQFFGLLRCLGASKAQVRRFVLLEGIRFSLRGIPLGIVVGTVIVWSASAYLRAVNPGFFQEMPLFGISWISWMGGSLTGFITVIAASLAPSRKAARISPLSAVTGNLDTQSLAQSARAAQTKHVRVEVAMGLRHAFASPKNIMLLTGSFAVSIVLFLGFSILVQLMSHALIPLKPGTPDVSLVSPAGKASLSSALMERIKVVPDVSKIYGRKNMSEISTRSAAGEASINLISYEEQQFYWARKQLIKGSVREVEEVKNSVLVVESAELAWKIGDTIHLKFPSGEHEVRVAGILSSSAFRRVPGVFVLIGSESTFTALAGAQDYGAIDVQLDRAGGDDTVTALRDLVVGIQPAVQVSDQRQSNSEVQAMFSSFAIFTYGFLVIIALITVFNIVNSMNTSVTGRIYHYGVMRAVGMTVKQLRRMVAAEAAAYAFSGCLAGCSIGIPLHYYLYTIVITERWGFDWEVPLDMLGIILGLTLVTAMVSVIGPVKRIGRLEIVQMVNK
ncbi:ABC transporter permease [Paenibacillus donghaensis]|uniref:ABC transporter permease n=1 Tax=Paenibacillus donghaensis TaxID=414771 RepID=A0A2Z2KB25_9BACL|nr:ABC transporter permease [Paenibacillus donghaensis]ASA22874.1 hypothetical protein B9T62_19935 [Paenibacillus donghaensis]